MAAGSAGISSSRGCPIELIAIAYGQGEGRRELDESLGRATVEVLVLAAGAYGLLNVGAAVTFVRVDMRTVVGFSPSIDKL